MPVIKAKTTRTKGWMRCTMASTQPSDGLHRRKCPLERLDKSKTYRSTALSELRQVQTSSPRAFRVYAMSQRVSLDSANTSSSLLNTAFAHEDGCIEAEANSNPCLAMERACDGVAVCQLVKTQQHCLPGLAVETALLELTWLSSRIDLIICRTS